MNANSRSPSLREQFGRKSECWEERTEPIFRFWTGDEQCFGFPFFSLFWSAYLPGPKTVSLHFPPGTVLVRGPKALDFYDGFCANKATLLKADGKDVVDVKFIPKEEDEAAGSGRLKQSRPGSQ